MYMHLGHWVIHSAVCLFCLLQYAIILGFIVVLELSLGITLVCLTKEVSPLNFRYATYSAHLPYMWCSCDQYM